MSAAPQPWHVVVLWPVALVTNILAAAAGMFLWSMPILTATILGQIVGFGLVGLVAMAAFRYKWADAGLVLPLESVWPAILPMGILAWLAAMPLALWSDHYFPLSEEMQKMMEGIILHPSLALTMLAVAVLPALLEEFTFRGLIFGALRRWSLPAAIILSSALFAITHLMPAYFLFTFALGILLCLLVVRTGSIWPGSLVHFTLNATTILLARNAAQAPENAPNQAGQILMWLEGMPVLTGVALLLFSAGALYYLVLALPGRAPAPDPAK